MYSTPASWLPSARAHRRAPLVVLVASTLLICLGALMWAGPAAPARAADPSTGDMDMVAWRDDNGNTIMDAEEARVANVVIAARKADSGFTTQCVTDDAGVCLLSSLLPGWYYLSVQPPAELRVTFPGSGTIAEAVQAGQTTHVRLGLALAANPTASPTPSPTPSATPTRSVLRRDITFQHKMDGYPYCNPALISGCYRVPEDTYLDGWQPDTSLSEKDVLRLRATGLAQDAAPLLKFDLFRIPGEAEVLTATLSLYVGYAVASENTDVAVYRMLRSWDAGQANWRRARAGESWQAVGGNGVGVDRAGTPESSATLRGAGQWVEFDVTEAVRLWVRDPSANHGLMLRSIDATSGGYRYEFISSEPAPGQGKDGLRPKLRVVYEAPPTPLEGRFGVGFSYGFRDYPEVERHVTDYDWEIMRIGWYSDWSYTASWNALKPYLPQGTEYVHRTC